MLDTSFIGYFKDIMNQYFHYLNHNWQCKKLNTTGKTKHNSTEKMESFRPKKLSWRN